MVLFFLPIVCSAQTVYFSNNLYYGLTNNPDVLQLQEFLTTQSVYNGPITGNFYSLTLAAVKAFQKAETITPVSGYFGPISRNTANTILAAETSLGEQNAATTTEPIDLATTTILKPFPLQSTSPLQQPPQTFGNITPMETPVVKALILARTPEVNGTFAVTAIYTENGQPVAGVPITLTGSDGGAFTNINPSDLVTIDTATGNPGDPTGIFHGSVVINSHHINQNPPIIGVNAVYTASSSPTTITASANGVSQSQ